MQPTRRDLMKLAAAAVAGSALPAWAEELGLQAVGGPVALNARGILQAMPSAREGSGWPIWILSSSRCGYCLKMNRERPGPVAGVESNYIAWPLVDTESGAVAQVWRARTAAAYRRFMAGALRDVPPIPVTPPRARSPHHATPDAQLTDAQLFDKHYAEMHIVKSLWADAQGRIRSVTPESYLFVYPPDGHALIRLPGDGVPVLQAMQREYPDWLKPR